MSVLRTVEAVPSRVAGVGRYLAIRANGEERAKVEAMLSPPRLGKGNMIKEVIGECLNMSLLETTGESSDKLVLSPTASETLKRGHVSAEAMRELLGGLLLTPDNDRNHDLCRLLAWFLAQETTTLSGGRDARDKRDALSRQLDTQVGSNWFGLTNEAQLDNFGYWAVYLGFAWQCSTMADKSERLLPDPTGYIFASLPVLFGEAAEMGLPEFLESLAQRCPVFEGGAFYGEIKHHLKAREEEYLPSSMALALSRLRYRGVVDLERRADAPGRLMPSVAERYTHIVWKRPGKTRSRKKG